MLLGENKGDIQFYQRNLLRPKIFIRNFLIGTKFKSVKD